MTQKLLKDMTNEELEDNYKIIMKWTWDRENARTPKEQREFEMGLRRVEDYEIELGNRGYTEDQLMDLYSTVIFDGKVPD